MRSAWGRAVAARWRARCSARSPKRWSRAAASPCSWCRHRASDRRPTIRWEIQDPGATLGVEAHGSLGTILVVDDNVELAENVVEILEVAGHAATMVTSAEAALQRVAQG